jgi:hypothetical protein
MSDFNSKIRANFDPNSTWSSNEFNTTLVDLDKIVGTSLETRNMSVNGTQTAYGQKSFLNLYITSSSQARNYESILSYLQNEISPVTNNGAKGISTDVIKEFSFGKPNVSGATASIGQLNPVFRNGNILITRPNGTSILIEANNIPLAAYDIAKLGNPPKTSTNEVGAYYWATSKTFTSSTTVNFSSFVGGTTDGRYEVIVGYKDSDGSFSPFVVKEGFESSLSSDYKSFRKIGFLRVSSGSIINFIQSNGDYYLAPFIGDTVGTFNPADWIRSHCLITFNIIQGSSAEYVSAVPTKTLYRFANNVSSISNPYELETMQVKIPFFYSNGFPGFSFTGTPTNRYLAKISFGCLL